MREEATRGHRSYQEAPLITQDEKKTKIHIGSLDLSIATDPFFGLHSGSRDSHIKKYPSTLRECISATTYPFGTFYSIHPRYSGLTKTMGMFLGTDCDAITMISPVGFFFPKKPHFVTRI